MSLVMPAPDRGTGVRDNAARVPATSALPSSRGLKICFISETLSSGVGRHIADLVCALSERGHEIHLLYSPIRCDAPFLAAVERGSTARCRAIPMPRAIGWRDLTAFARILKYLRANGPFDVIHGHSSKGGGYARLLGLLGHRPVVYTPHAFVTMSPRKGLGPRLYRVIEAVFGRVSDRIICESLLERDHARRLGLAERKLTVICHGSAGDDSLPREAARQRLGLERDEIAVGFVGRLDEQKAPERMIAAARQLCSELPKLTFVMIGDGPKRRLLEAEAQRAGLSDRVRWMGALNSRHLMLAFDIFAVPSLYEGFPYVFLEALHAGLPIVTTAVGGAQETVEPGVNGFIVPDAEGGRMAEPLRRLATGQRLRRAMGKASRDRSRMFSIASMVDATEDLYRTLVPASAAPKQASFAAISESETETLGSGFEAA